MSKKLSHLEVLSRAYDGFFSNLHPLMHVMAVGENTMIGELTHQPHIDWDLGEVVLPTETHVVRYGVENSLEWALTKGIFSIKGRYLRDYSGLRPLAKPRRNPDGSIRHVQIKIYVDKEIQDYFEERKDISFYVASKLLHIERPESITAGYNEYLVNAQSIVEEIERISGLGKAGHINRLDGNTKRRLERLLDVAIKNQMHLVPADIHIKSEVVRLPTYIVDVAYALGLHKELHSRKIFTYSMDELKRIHE